MIGKKVPGEGKVPNRLMLVGEGPGKNEAIEERPFVGASGVELDYLYLRRAAGLDRSDFYITNVVKWRTDENDSDPKPEDIRRDEPELLAEITVVNPDIIVAVGKVAASWFLQTDDVDFEKYHGCPVVCPRYPSKTLLCAIHPAAALHQSERYSHIVYWDFEQLGRLVRGEIGVCQDTVQTDYTALLRGNDERIGLAAVDTEGSQSRPWGLSYSTTLGEGRVIKKGLSTPKFERAIMHNALYDLGVLKSLGVEDIKELDDSMLMAYLLPWLPKRLKALSFKLCGISQEEYEDVTREAEQRLSRGYLGAVIANRCGECNGAGTVSVPYKRNSSKFRTVKCSRCEGDATNWPLPQPQLVFDGNYNGKVYKPRSVGRGVRKLLERGTELRDGWMSIDEEVRRPIEDQLGTITVPTLDDVEDQERVIHYSAADADATLRVYNVLKPIIEQEGLQRVYEIDKGIIPIIDRMQTNGILIDRDHFAKLDKQFSEEQMSAIDKLSQIAGYTFNPSSPLQVKDLLYDRMKLKPLRGNVSTDDKSMQSLKIRYASREDVAEVIDLIGEHRELSKLKGTYVNALPRAADRNGRVHTRFLLHVTNTGRLSSRDPNLQNQPTKTERGKLIRKGFIAKDGCVLVSVDLDQIELRVAAHMSEDENMIEVFRTGRDIHRATAALVYSKDMKAISVYERLTAKTLNFLILYGGSANRLHAELSLLGITTTKDQCVQYINDWFSAYPRIRDFMEQCHSQAKQMNYVECMFGRRRYIPGVHSYIDKVKEESLRWSTNFPIQATAAGALKLWLKSIWDDVLPNISRLGYCEPLLTVHDEVIFEVEKGLEDLLISMIVDTARSCIDLLVPVAAKGAAAGDWSLLK